MTASYVTVRAALSSKDYEINHIINRKIIFPNFQMFTSLSNVVSANHSSGLMAFVDFPLGHSLFNIFASLFAFEDM